MKKENKLRVLKFLSTCHYRFFQIVFAVLVLIAAKGIIIQDMNGSRRAALTLLVSSSIAVVVFQFFIMSKYKRIEKEFKL